MTTRLIVAVNEMSHSKQRHFLLFSLLQLTMVYATVITFPSSLEENCLVCLFFFLQTQKKLSLQLGQ